MQIRNATEKLNRQMCIDLTYKSNFATGQPTHNPLWACSFGRNLNVLLTTRDPESPVIKLS